MLAGYGGRDFGLKVASGVRMIAREGSPVVSTLAVPTQLRPFKYQVFLSPMMRFNHKSTTVEISRRFKESFQELGQRAGVGFKLPGR